MVRRPHLRKLTAATLAASLLATALPARATEVTFDRECLKRNRIVRISTYPPLPEGQGPAKRSLTNILYQRLKVAESIINSGESDSVKFKFGTKNPNVELLPMFVSPAGAKITTDVSIQEVSEKIREYTYDDSDRSSLLKKFDEFFDKGFDVVRKEDSICIYRYNEKKKKILFVIAPTNNIFSAKFSGLHCFYAISLKILCVEIDFQDKEKILSMSKMFFARMSKLTQFDINFLKHRERHIEN